MKKRAILALVLIFSLMLSAYSVFAETENEPATGGNSVNLENAMNKYNVSPDDVLVASSAEEITVRLAEAGKSASTDRKVIVHVQSGSYVLAPANKTYVVLVPENVILVAENDSYFTPAEKRDVFIQMKGSMYGGKYDSEYKNKTTIKLQQGVIFSNLNGQIDSLTVTRSNYYGIVAKNSKNAVITNCSVNKCKASGISILKESKAGDTNIKSIIGCDVSNNGTAGINLSWADVGTIRGCTINNNKDKAVSTNSDSSTGCHIGTIDRCTMCNNKTNGVHIKPNCTLDHFTNNTLIGNNDGIIAAAITKEKTKGKSIIKDVSNNTFQKSETPQIEAQGKGASITIGSNNKVTSGKTDKTYGILAMNSGKVTIKGSNNVFKGNFKGIGAQSSGSITVKGNNNQFVNNKAYGVHAITKGTVSIAGNGNKISGNKKSAIYCATKGKVTITKKVKVSGKIYKTSKGKVIKKKK